MKKIVVWTAMVLLHLGVSLNAEENWKTVVGLDQLTQASGCLIESAELTINDGQATTPVKFIYNGKVFVVVTKSNIDLTYPDVGLQVDDYEQLPIDRTYKNTSVVFEDKADQIKEQFIKGYTAKLALGFWPSWPQGETIITEFSLIGFTEAYNELVACQESGSPSSGG